MKAILIDPTSRAVKYVDVKPGIDAIYEAINAETFTVITLDDKGTALFLDDEGLYKPNQDFFQIGDYKQPLAGRGLILGTNEAGESEDAKVSAAFVYAKVRWLEPQEAVDLYKQAQVETETQAAIENAKGKMFHVVAMPDLSIDPETGKARVL